ncbi:MAG TPA: amidohydrolase family protein [Candidatus Binatia bacterium]|nr:amidohydrolase family protein [Candidatus Binatia bacterium]
MRIDFHTHYIPRSVERLKNAHADWPRLAIEAPDCGQLYRGEAHYRTIDDRSWDASRRIADMDRWGLDMQVVSPIPVTYAYDCPSEAGRELARVQNDGIAELVRSNPKRFAGLCSVPLQDVDAACAELERAVRDLGLIGVEIGSAVGPVDVANERFEPFWQTCEQLDGIVFLHPERFPGAARLGAHRLVFSSGYPSETGITAAQLIMGGLFARHPKLRFVLAHGGGTLPWLLPRLDQVWSSFADLREALPQRPSQVARSFYCDTLTYDVANLAVVIERIGLERLMLGSDYPFPLMEDPPGKAIAASSTLDDECKALLAGANAARILGLSARTNR